MSTLTRSDFESIWNFNQVINHGDALPCPRCGQNTMKHNLRNNALSNQLQLHICEECRVDEARRAIAGNPLPVEEWHAYKKQLTKTSKESIKITFEVA